MTLQRSLPRRTILRGLGTTLALPFLDAMVPAFARQLSTGDTPNRMVFVYVPNGIVMNAWTPVTQQPITPLPTQLPRVLQPISAYRNDFSILSGLTHNGGRALGDGPGDHARAGASYLTGVHPKKTFGADIHAGISADQIAAIYGYLILNGLPLDEDTLRFNASLVKTFLYHDPSVADDVTVLSVGIVGSRELSQVAVAGDRLEKLLPILEDSPSITNVGLTGSPFTRNAQLMATTRTLQTSVPIAAVGAFILLLVTMRSFRYALVTIIPIGLVVAWLYGFMSMTGFALNFVTATIGAISIGVGIDFSIHMTERFREELGKAPDKYQALCQAARGTGVALVASAASSIVGFGIMGFAPMPMFASFGQLTAVMIFLALAASLVVLPSLLLLVTPNDSSLSGTNTGD